MSETPSDHLEFYMKASPVKVWRTLIQIFNSKTLFLGYLGSNVVGGGSLEKGAIIEAIGENVPGGGIPIKGKVLAYSEYDTQFSGIGALRFEFDDLAFYNKDKMSFHYPGNKTTFHFNVEKSGSGDANETFIILSVSFYPIKTGWFSKISPSTITPLVIKYIESHLPRR